MSATASEERPARRRLLVLLPLALGLALAALFFYRLGSGDPARIPSALIGRPAPETNLPPVPGLLARDGKPLPGIAARRIQRHVRCECLASGVCSVTEAPCQRARRDRIRLVGINYKDQPDNARRFLGRHGNPFVAAGADGNGRASMEWGVYGVPETFLVGRDGKIAYKLVGPITEPNLERVLKPEIEKALAAKP